MSDKRICPPDHPHGENSTCYTAHGCRCEDCRQQRREDAYWRFHMGRAGKPTTDLVDATGTHRRIQALVALGWSAKYLSERLGHTPGWAGHVLEARRVTPETADAVQRIYDELSMRVPNPRDRYEKQAVSLTLRVARMRGWVPPLAWDDETIDDPAATPHVDDVGSIEFDHAVVALAIEGKKPRMTTAERWEAIRILHGRAWSAQRIADWLGCDPKTVERVRERLQLPVPDQMTIRDAA